MVCVRYRYDYANKKSVKTIELIISEEILNMPPLHPDEDRPVKKSTLNTQRVPIKIDRDEYALQQQIKAIGGKWSYREKLWYASEYHVHQIGLGDRIVKKG